jgi:hypothetical protein
MTARKIGQRSISHKPEADGEGGPYLRPAERSPIIREMKIPFPIPIKSLIGMKSTRPHPSAGIDPSPVQSKCQLQKEREGFSRGWGRRARLSPVGAPHETKPLFGACQHRSLESLCCSGRRLAASCTTATVPFGSWNC